MSLTRSVVFHRESLPPLAVLEGEWRRLEAAGKPSFFTSWQWIGTLLAAVPETSRPMLLRGRADGDTVVLALLGAKDSRRRHGLVRSRGLYINETGDPRFDSVMIEHNGMLVAAGYQTVAWETLLTWFAGLRDELDELYLNGSLLRLPDHVLEARGLTRNEIAVPSFLVDLCRLESADGELYPVLSASARQQLRRTFRYFERFGELRLRPAATIAEALAFFTAMKALHCASWERRGRPHSFVGEFFEPFHRLLIERSFAEGGTELLRASAGERVIGYLYNFRLNNRIYAYQSGFDDVDRRERPGMATHALAIRHAFRTGARIYDFMAGRNQLKESFATRCEPMLWQAIQQPRLVFRLENFGRRMRHGLRQAINRRHLIATKKSLLEAHRNDTATAINRQFRW